MVHKQFRKYSVMSYPIHVDNSNSIQISLTSLRSKHNATKQTARCQAQGATRPFIPVKTGTWRCWRAVGACLLMEILYFFSFRCFTGTGLSWWDIAQIYFFAQPRSACSLACDSSLQQDLGGVKKLFDYSPFNHFIQIFAEFVILYSHYHSVL